MNAVMVPGQGTAGFSLLDHTFEEKAFWLERAEHLLGRPITSNDILDHDVNSAVITASAIAICQCFQKYGGRCEIVLGYSIGQIAALSIAKVLDFESSLRLSILRAQLMRRYTAPGLGMLSVLGLPEGTVKHLVAIVSEDPSAAGRIYTSNLNSDYSFTVAGSMRLLKRFELLAQRSGAKRLTYLPTEGAWHSPLLVPAIADFRQLLGDFTFHSPQAVFIDNVTGVQETDPVKIKENLPIHLVSPVLWHSCMVTAISLGASRMLECGAGRQLSTLALFISRDLRCYSLNTEEDIRRCAELSAC